MIAITTSSSIRVNAGLVARTVAFRMLMRKYSLPGEMAASCIKRPTSMSPMYVAGSADPFGRAEAVAVKVLPTVEEQVRTQPIGRQRPLGERF
jgi:hypothetical protein